MSYFNLPFLLKRKPFIGGGEITPEEQKLSKHVALYESRRSGMWDLPKEINQEEQSLAELKSDAG